ncbi:MAG: hypothetical protein GWN99_01915 [Gemmatimonadetes bacterium]|uniref:Uncharacterized protein n=1 Tax=Candidatus Kutchimonas denitrificans TaxID=3056748 RepID=A0AAE4Z9W7_9BACT|nr:hypothetical protein [Gemmatimonadota bacterium]NIR74201.1 hypothetical protein [Candidatus Kutchimonas denitrificans]NIR99823.1 hypothetical protein [Gemmatimonadota bacterium]NIT65412.1 hypothetical protein [Gemmatimonadota bacterium]NIV22134.1 hypothetical protein [Gemmatimonadota bacterium]
MTMDPVTGNRSETYGSSAFPETRTELRWRDAEFWPVRRPYPVEVPCPVCGTSTLCDFFGTQSCPRGHPFGQRAFWSGRATSCALLLEDLRDGRMFIYPQARLCWRDDARAVVG